MAITLINRTTLDKSYSVLINKKKVDVLTPYETLLVALQEEPSQLSFRFVPIKPIAVCHDDIIVLTDHKIGVFLRNPWIVSAIIALANIIPFWTQRHFEQFFSFEDYNYYFFWHRLLITLSIIVIPTILTFIFPPFTISKE